MTQWELMLDLKGKFQFKTLKLGAQGMRRNGVSSQVWDRHTKQVTHRI